MPLPITMNKKTIIGAIALLTALAQILLFAYGCGARKKSMLKEQLKGEWRITQLGEIAVGAEADQMTFSFDFDRSMAGGMGYCNSYGTNFTLSNNGDCDFEAVFSTRVGCDGNRAETILGINLQKSKKLVLKGDTLSFYESRNAEGEPLIVMQRISSPLQ